MEARNTTRYWDEPRCLEARTILDSIKRDGGITGKDGILQKLTFTDIAAATGVSRSYVSGFASGTQYPGPERIDKLVEYLAQYYPERFSDSKPQAAPVQGEQGADITPMTGQSYKSSVELYATKEFKQAIGWCNYVQTKRRMGVMIGYPGSGKTTILREFCKRNPDAHYIECWPMMRVSDLLGQLAGAAGASLSGNNFAKTQQILQALSARSDITLIFDEAEYLRTWDVTKFEVLRKLWDNTGTPVIIAGTPELESILTRGSGRENLAQLYRRKYEIKLSGIQYGEVKQILADYNITPDAAAELCKIASDARHGGMGNFVEILDMCLEAAGAGANGNGGQIDMAIVNGAKQYKLMY